MKSNEEKKLTFSDRLNSGMHRLKTDYCPILEALPLTIQKVRFYSPLAGNLSCRRVLQGHEDC
jgi:hypothetical protein